MFDTPFFTSQVVSRVSCGFQVGVWRPDVFYSILKFFALDVSLVGGVAVSGGPAPDSAFAPSLFGRPFGQLPYLPLYDAKHVSSG
jgi:hypothetical protein